MQRDSSSGFSQPLSVRFQCVCRKLTPNPSWDIDRSHSTEWARFKWLTFPGHLRFVQILNWRRKCKHRSYNTNDSIWTPCINGSLRSSKSVIRIWLFECPAQWTRTFEKSVPWRVINFEYQNTVFALAFYPVHKYLGDFANCHIFDRITIWHEGTILPTALFLPEIDEITHAIIYL